jgi:cell wall-associated NlpC family hydrolase
MRRNWLASAAVAAVAISVPVTAVSAPEFAGTARAATLGQQKTAPSSATRTPIKVLKKVTKKAPVTWNMVAAAKAKKLVGYPYIWGGNTIAGFDCSGLTQWVYWHTGHGKVIQRTAEAQFLQFRRISHASARPGDLVFFHDSSAPTSYVYHVGVYEGGEDMVAATTFGEGVQFQSFAWGGDTVTFGTITH